MHHSDRGVQYLSIRYTERLAEAGIEPSVGSVGDSYDNALAETINGLYKAEVIRRHGPWRSLEDVEFATLEWVDWFNNRRLLEPIGNIPPAEAEARYYAQIARSRHGGLTQTKSPPGNPGRFNVEHDAVLVHRPPQPVLLARDFQHDFIEMSFVSGRRQSAGSGWRSAGRTSAPIAARSRG